MGFLSNLFLKEQIQCKRCLGKGSLDWDDISRLNRKLYWNTGSCAYCEGSGKVTVNFENKIAVDSLSLTSDLSSQERAKLISKDPNALRRAQIRENELNRFITEVTFLYYDAKLDSDKIFEFYSLDPNYSEIMDDEKLAIKAYISRIIKEKAI